MDATHLDLALLAGAGVLLVAVGGVRLANRIGVPGLLLYLGIGMVIGEDGLGLHFDNAELARNIGLVALALILAEGGLTTAWRGFVRALPVGIVLSTFGVAVSVAVTAVIAHLAIGVNWRTAGLIAAVLSSTDAAAVFSTLRGVRIPPRLVGVLETESGLNDAPTVILVTLLAAQHPYGIGHAVGVLVYELAVGAGIGLVIGVAGAEGLRRAALPAAGLYPFATMTCAVASYAAADVAGASGFLAVYLTTVWLARSRLPHRRATLGFAEGVAWLAQIGLFVMLGLLSDPSRLDSAIVPALAVAGGLLFLARPLSVLASASWFRVPLREQALLSWAGLRGAVPIVLTTIPLSTGFAGATKVFDTVFVVVVLLTLLQSPLLRPISRALGLELVQGPRELTVEAAPLDDIYADLLQVTITPTSRMHNMEVWELRLPPGAAVTLVVRDEKAFVPDSDAVLRHGDQLLVVTTRDDRAATERRLQAVSDGGRLTRFLGTDR